MPFTGFTLFPLADGHRRDDLAPALELWNAMKFLADFWGVTLTCPAPAAGKVDNQADVTDYPPTPPAGVMDYGCAEYDMVQMTVGQWANLTDYPDGFDAEGTVVAYTWERLCELSGYPATGVANSRADNLAIINGLAAMFPLLQATVHQAEYAGSAKDAWNSGYADPQTWATAKSLCEASTPVHSGSASDPYSYTTGSVVHEEEGGAYTASAERVTRELQVAVPGDGLVDRVKVEWYVQALAYDYGASGSEFGANGDGVYESACLLWLTDAAPTGSVVTSSAQAIANASGPWTAGWCTMPDGSIEYAKGWICAQAWGVVYHNLPW